MSVDTSFYYQLTNSFLGSNQALNVKPDGSGQLEMSTKDGDSKQLWKMVDLGGGKYALRTEYLGDCFSLDVMNNRRKDTPWIAPTGNYPGQSWSLTPRSDGTYRLTNDFTGPGRFLDTTGDTHKPILAPGDASGQHWTLTPAKKIESNVAIPDLDSKGHVDKTEGLPTDFNLYAKPEGVVRAVMIFVEFPDAPGTASPDDVARHLLGNGSVQKLFGEQSYQRMTLDVTIESRLGWRKMKDSSGQYKTHQFSTHKDYLDEAAGLFSSDLEFSDYSLVFVATPEGAHLNGASAFTAPQGKGAAGDEIRLAVTFDGTSLQERYTTLVHELGHLFGLPDHYPDGGGANNQSAGCWSVMSDIFHSLGFLGWHRHKNGWLDATRKTYLDSDTTGWSATLHPLSGPCGLSMVVLPIDDAAKPSEVFVVELAQPVLGSNNEIWGEGVLLYTVNAQIPTGCEPVVILPKKTDTSPVFGSLFKAPYLAGDTATHVQGKASIKLTVVRKIGYSYDITIDYKKP